MNISLETLKEQLAQLRQRDEMIFKHRAIIKNWCITIWFAVLAAIATNKLALNATSALAILTAPVLLFWLLEATYGAITSLLIKQGKELEQRIADKDLSIDKASDVFVISRYLRFSNSEKAIAFLRAVFTLETVIIFYLILLVASVFFIFLLYS